MVQDEAQRRERQADDHVQCVVELGRDDQERPDGVDQVHEAARDEAGGLRDEELPEEDLGAEVLAPTVFAVYVCVCRRPNQHLWWRGIQSAMFGW